jgi:putative ABC transport system substrate-binding protein
MRRGRATEDLKKTKDVTVKSSQAFLTVILAFALLAVPVSSPGQQPGKVYRIGWLAGARSETPRECRKKGTPFWQAWLGTLRERGYVDGENLVIECRYTDGRDERAALLAAELVSLKVDLIVAGLTNQVWAAKQATGTVPIVMWGVIDPVGRGLVSSLARPGGNVTGLTDLPGAEILEKYLQLLTEAVPKASRVAVLRDLGARGVPSIPLVEQTLQAEARALRVTLQSYHVRDPEELEGVFSAMTKARAETLLVVPSPFFTTHAKRIVDLAAQSRLPAMYPDKAHVEIGGFMAYVMNYSDIPQRLAEYVARILKGAKPGDLPVEQPTEFKLVINLKTAKALGLTIPPTLLIQAEEVIR